jgi:predicted Mrr-cat superfamily restriction endonuclease
MVAIEFIGRFTFMPRVWKISPGESAKAWPMCRQRQCIVLGWRALRNYRRFGRDQDAIVRFLGGRYGNGRGAARSILRFAYDIRRSDVVVANEGRSTVVGIGLIRGDYLPPGSPKNPGNSSEYPHAREVEWIVKQPVELGKTFFAASTVTLLRTEKVNQIRRAYARQFPELKKRLDRLFASVLIDDQGPIETQKILKAAEKQLEEQEAFDPKDLRDARKRVVTSIVRRQGQPEFRRRLLAAYDRKCAISGCEVVELLEAAHLFPYNGPKTNHVANGLLLRADLHTLLDLNLIAIDDAKMCVVVSPKLSGTEYERYRRVKIRVPKLAARRPSVDALKARLRLYESEQ